MSCCNYCPQKLTFDRIYFYNCKNISTRCFLVCVSSITSTWSDKKSNRSELQSVLLKYLFTERPVRIFSSHRNKENLWTFYYPQTIRAIALSIQYRVPFDFSLKPMNLVEFVCWEICVLSLQPIRL